MPQRIVALLIVLSCSTTFADDGFKPIFNGKTLDGWSAPDMSYWSVEDGAIVGKSSEEHPCRKNQFLVWQQGTLDDFILTLQFKITGADSANGGVQIRSGLWADGHAVGYQADIDKAGKWVGGLYDEEGRGVLATRGQKTIVGEDGKKDTQQVGDADQLMAAIKVDDWNDYRIEARGNHITLSINGKITAEVIDNQTAERDLTGILALQLHSGPAMTVAYRDIQLKRLPLTDGRKKLVLIAGHPSHPSGEHEFNAGIKLLARRLEKIPTVAVSQYHDNGWPKDPTAFDNADAVVIYADGGRGHPVVGHVEELDKLADKGVGIMCMHYAVQVDGPVERDAFKKWIGGFYENGYSINPHWDAVLKINTQHPIGTGIVPAKVHDEWYFNMRWRDDDAKTVTPILEAVPDDEARSGSTASPRGPKKHIVDASGRSEILMWAIERPDGGRGVGFTGGHFHNNWAIDTQRNVVLNAMLWVAKAPIPEGGVKSEPVTEEELNKDLDSKKNMIHVTLPAGVQ